MISVRKRRVALLFEMFTILVTKSPLTSLEKDHTILSIETVCQAK